ncbi:MAG: TonB-dependent receptor plug domain-containing protein, partial [Gammaproteobacteria bacterium]
RRDQAVLEIPYNISALKGEDLAKLGVSDFTSIARHVPGLVATDTGVRTNGLNSSFIIRGINASTVSGGAFQDLISPSVSSYIDETPMFANLRLNDVARVEVLRGPQGTLYGAGSVGGTIRIIHNAPSTEATEFRLSAEGATVEESDDLDYKFDAVANIPVNERVALRFSAGYEELAGFIDATRSVVTDGDRVPLLADPSDPVGSPYITEQIEDVDSSDTWFLRGSALFDVTEDVRVLLSYHHQDENADGFSAQQLDGKPYTMGRPIAREPSERKLDLFAATVTADLGFATLTSATGYFEQEEESVRDISLIPTIFAQYYGYYPRITLPGYDWFSSESFTQEIRLVSSGEGPLRWT